MQILGVIASGISGNLYFASYDSIATQTVGGSPVSSVTFNSIPAGYTHLQIRGYAQESSDTVAIRFNSDTSNNYTTHYMTGDGSNTASGHYASPTMMYIQTSYGASAGSERFGTFICDILDYSNTNKKKTIRSLTGCANPTVNGKIFLYSGEWYSTNAVTSITIQGSTGVNLTQNSTFALYGVKVA